MSATIRLARHGARKKPFYRIIVADRRFAEDGRRLEQLGVYDPRQSPSRIELDAERVAEWLRRGARPSARPVSTCASWTGWFANRGTRSNDAMRRSALIASVVFPGGRIECR